MITMIIIKLINVITITVIIRISVTSNKWETMEICSMLTKAQQSRRNVNCISFTALEIHFNFKEMLP